MFFNGKFFGFGIYSANQEIELEINPEKLRSCTGVIGNGAEQSTGDIKKNFDPSSIAEPLEEDPGPGPIHYISPTQYDSTKVRYSFRP